MHSQELLAKGLGGVINNKPHWAPCDDPLFCKWRDLGQLTKSIKSQSCQEPRCDGQWGPRATRWDGTPSGVSSYPEQRLRKTRTAQERGSQDGTHPSRGPFLLNLPLGNDFELHILFLLPSFVLPHLHPSGREARRYSKRNVERATIQLPTPFSSPSPTHTPTILFQWKMFSSAV